MTWKTLGAVCLTLAVSAPATAEQGRGQNQGQNQAREREMMPAQLLNLKMTLELSDDQVDQLESLQEAFVEQREARRAQAQDLREQARSGDV